MTRPFWASFASRYPNWCLFVDLSVILSAFSSVQFFPARFCFAFSELRDPRHSLNIHNSNNNNNMEIFLPKKKWGKWKSKPPLNLINARMMERNSNGNPGRHLSISFFFFVCLFWNNHGNAVFWRSNCDNGLTVWIGPGVTTWRQ